MLSRIRSRLSYANVMATVAVFLALGGGVAYAANTIFSRDIVNGEVKTADVANDSTAAALRGTDIATNTLTGSDISESALGTVPDADSLGGTSASGYGRVLTAADDEFTGDGSQEVSLDVPGVGVFSVGCSDGGTPDEPEDDTVGPVLFERTTTNDLTLTWLRVDTGGGITVNEANPAFGTTSFGVTGEAILVSLVAIPEVAGGPTAKFEVSGHTLGGGLCAATIHAVRSGDS